ncbi:MAG: hypothetical protein ABSE82_16145 [Nitrososphaerales archaeon]
MTTAETLTAIIAAYGAVVSTIAVAKQIISYRVSIKMTVGLNMETRGDPHHDGTTLIILKVVNKGRRPVTITHTGAWCLYPNNPFLCTDTQPDLAHEIKEGESIMTYLPKSAVDVETIDFWQAMDSTGRVYKLRQASRLKHWRSELQRKWAHRASIDTAN